ncbi:IS3 family transposase [Streptobacillus felis]|uniref:IS3 family transposase n=1 Tax=Streptobacillus felis TaxID=1384509 RepID=A0A7Z0PE31_9FUSO|nr:IS3 family transposase [Streptobacillus felis]
MNLAKYLTIEELNSKYTIKYLYKILELNRSSYYNYLKIKDIDRDLELIDTIKTIAREFNYTYGRKRMTIEVNKRLSSKFNEKKIRRIMIEEDIVCVIRVKKRIFKKSSEEYVVENILSRDFTTSRDNEKISTDVTEITTGEGKLYLGGIIDMHSKSLVSYKIGKRNNNELVFDTFKDFINKNNICFSSLTLQSDRGFQYTSYGFKQIIQDITHSMNRPGHCPDNSLIESFWGTFKSECYYNPYLKDSFKTVEGATKAIEEYINFYNNIRINLKGTTPNQIRSNSLNL